MPGNLLIYGKKLLILAKRSWLIIFIAACSILIVRYLDSLAEHFNHNISFNLKYFALTLVAQVGFWLLLTITWKNIVAEITFTRIPLLTSFSHMALVGLGKYLPGKVWGMVVRWSHMSKQGISSSKSIIATYMEQILLLHAGIVLSGVLTALVFQTNIAWLIGFLSLLSVFIAARYHNPLLSWLLGKLNKIGYFKSTVDIPLSSFPYLQYLTAYFVIWMLSGLVLTLLFMTFLQRDSLSIELLLALLLANTAGISAGFLALFAPGGIGVREAVSIAMLSPFMPLSDAVAITVLSRIWLVATDLMGGGVGMVILHKKKELLP